MFGAWGSGCRVYWGLGCRVKGFGLKVGVKREGLRVWG